GEDMDGFHVRNTYAQLEILGVKGDGYEEGVERTRARVGSSRASQYAAEAAIADSAEKKRDLDAYEVDLLNNLDRYGFYSVTSHDRLALLPTASLPAITLTSSLKSPNLSTAPPAVKALPPPTRSIKEDSRIEKWQRMLVPQQHGFPQWVFRPSLQDSKLRRRIYKGIPDRWRSVAWMVLLERMVMKDKRVNIHDECVRLERVYREELEKASPFDIQIDLDVPRTISGHVMFKTRYGQGQRSLFHVLHSFSLHCLDCGYVQGMGPITATFLCYVPPVVAYRALVFLHTSPSYNIHSLFSPGFPGLLECIYLQEKLTQLAMPDVYNAFKKNMITSMSYATKWYITLFANTVPFQTMLRIWDAFLLEGVDVFCVVATAILWVYREYITSSNASFETILSLLSSFFVPENEDAFMHWIERTLGNRKIRTLFGEWRREWRTMVSEKREGNALL
ncbi:RabGAP/TBC, partial [Fistulina hepatica ATCC 64428]